MHTDLKTFDVKLAPFKKALSSLWASITLWAVLATAESGVVLLTWFTLITE